MVVGEEQWRVVVREVVSVRNVLYHVRGLSEGGPNADAIDLLLVTADEWLGLTLLALGADGSPPA